MAAPYLVINWPTIAAPDVTPPYTTTPSTAAAYTGGPYRVGDSTIFPVTIHDTFTPELAESPAKLINAEYLSRGIQDAHPSRLRNVLHKLSELPGMQQILMHYLLVDGICEDKEETYEVYERELYAAYAIVPQENAMNVKQALNEAHMQRATKRMSGGAAEVPIVVEDEDNQEETARPSLAPTKKVIQGAKLSKTTQPDNRPVLQDLPQQTQPTTKKRKSSRHVVCRQCEEVFDAEAGNDLEICLYHPGELEAEEDAFVDFDENCHEEEPDMFIWTCCKARGDQKGCTKGQHREMEGQRRRMF